MSASRDLPIVVSPTLPIAPSVAEDIVRMVRHGLADVLAWLGEDVGPRPGDYKHAIKTPDAPLVSQAIHDKLTDLANEAGRG